MAANLGWGARRFSRTRFPGRSGGTPRSFWPGSVFGGGNTLGQRRAVDGVSGTSPAPVDPTIPPMPTEIPPEGWSWVWNGSYWALTQREAPEEEKFDNNLMAYVSDLLEQYGLNTEGLLAFVEKAIEEGWSQSQIMLEIRKHPDYLANPLFAANVERAKNGGGWMSEGQVIAYANEVKRLAKQYGYAAPSDNYVAQNILTGRSLAEFEHRVQIQRNVENYGPAVRMVLENELGIVMGDEDLFELFDPEIDTEEWSAAYRNALYRGRPFALVLGIRSQREADALRLLGVDPDEAFNRYSQVAQNATRFDRLATIEQGILDKLPSDFGNFSAADNSTLVRALVFQDSQALAELQAMAAREIGRFAQGGGAVSSQGQAIGLLTSAERQSFG